MKTKFFKILAIVLVVLVLFPCTVVFAQNLGKKVDIYYRNIKLYVDGTEITPKDSTGNVVEPFIYNGTTYLPVRAVAQAFGHEVEWDGQTSSVYIGKKDETKPDNYLHKIQYNDFKKGNSNDSMSVIKSNIWDVDGNIYTNGLIFYNLYSNDNPSAVYYPLNSQYKKLKGNIVLPKDKTVSDTTVSFYGDDELLYQANNVTYSMPFKFDINVNGVNQLKIVVQTNKAYSSVCLTDLALYE